MKRVKQTSSKWEAHAIRELQLRKKSKDEFIQEVPPKLEELYNLWKLAGFPFIPRRTFQPIGLWQAIGVSGGLCLVSFYTPGSILNKRTDYRLYMARSSAALHFFKFEEGLGIFHPRYNLPLGEVYEIVKGISRVDREFQKNLDELIEILTIFNQTAAESTNHQS